MINNKYFDTNNNLIIYNPNLITEVESQEKNILNRNSIYYVVNSRQDLKTTTAFLDTDIQRRTTVAALDAQAHLSQSNNIAPSSEQIQKMRENAEKAEERAKKVAAWSKAGLIAAIGIGIFAGWKSKGYYDKINNSSSSTSSVSATSSSSPLVTNRPITSASDDVLATWKGPISGKNYTFSKEK